MSGLYKRYSDATVDQLLTIIWQYENSEPHHVPGCPLADLSYCLDCHADAHNARETLRARGVNQWPSDDWTPQP